MFSCTVPVGIPAISCSFYLYHSILLFFSSYLLYIARNVPELHAHDSALAWSV